MQTIEGIIQARSFRTIKSYSGTQIALAMLQA